LIDEIIDVIFSSTYSQLKSPLDQILNLLQIFLGKAWFNSTADIDGSTCLGVNQLNLFFHHPFGTLGIC
jgi:hypothetical protein